MKKSESSNNISASNLDILKGKLMQVENMNSRLNEQINELLQENDKVQNELDSIVLELKRTKIELALCEERKNESDQCYKNEIKYLIDKLLKTKTKLNKER